MGAATDNRVHLSMVGADPTYLAWMIEEGMIAEWPFEWTPKARWMRRGKAQHEIFMRRFNAAMQSMLQPPDKRGKFDMKSTSGVW